jgi:hypothetical protein
VFDLWGKVLAMKLVVGDVFGGVVGDDVGICVG